GSIGGGENWLVELSEINIFFAIEGSSVGDASRVFQGDHADVIADFLLGRISERMIERWADGSVGRPGEAGILRRHLVGFREVLVRVGTGIIPTGIQAAVWGD